MARLGHPHLGLGSVTARPLPIFGALAGRQLVEVISENFMDPRSPTVHVGTNRGAAYPTVMHGVSR